MVNCEWVQDNLTAWSDRELSRRDSDALQRHLATCEHCAIESRQLRAAIHRQRELLGQLAAAEAIETDALWGNVRRGLVEEEPAPWWGWFRQPLALAGGALTAGLLVVLVAAGGPRAILISLDIESPPTAVAREPELFKDYPLIRQLDALEYFDTVQSVPLDEESVSQNG